MVVFREGDRAAAAFIIGLWGEAGGTHKYEPFAAHGTILDAHCAMFMAEAIALDEAAAEVRRLIQSTSYAVRRNRPSLPFVPP